MTEQEENEAFALNLETFLKTLPGVLSASCKPVSTLDGLKIQGTVVILPTTPPQKINLIISIESDTPHD